MSSRALEEGGVPVHQDHPPPQKEPADACVIPISPWGRKQSEPPEQINNLMGVEESTCIPAVVGEEFTRVPAVTQEDEEEVEEGWVPRTRKCPDSLSTEELRVHSLTHIPYHPGCRCCVAGRKRDHKHPRRDSGHKRMHADLEAANSASICADYFFPRDKPGENGITALAVCDNNSQFLSGHVVDAKGASAEHAIKQVLRDLRKMGHYGSLKVRMDQESSISDLFKAVAKERGDARTVLTHAARSDSKGNGQAEKAVQSIEEMVRTLFIDLEQRCGEE